MVKLHKFYVTNEQGSIMEMYSIIREDTDWAGKGYFLTPEDVVSIIDQAIELGVIEKTRQYE